MKDERRRIFSFGSPPFPFPGRSLLLQLHVNPRRHCGAPSSSHRLGGYFAFGLSRRSAKRLKTLGKTLKKTEVFWIVFPSKDTKFRGFHGVLNALWGHCIGSPGKWSTGLLLGGERSCCGSGWDLRDRKHRFSGSFEYKRKVPNIQSSEFVTVAPKTMKKNQGVHSKDCLFRYQKPRFSMVFRAEVVSFHLCFWGRRDFANRSQSEGCRAFLLRTLGLS